MATIESEPLLQRDTAAKLIETVKFLHDRGDWFARMFLIMPDHVHSLIAIPPATSLAQRISSWKSYTHKHCGVDWQERVFDHRLRSEESLDEKAHYIRLSPMRAGLIEDAAEWPYLFDPLAVDGSAGTPRPT